MKFLKILILVLFSAFDLYALPFNENLSDEDINLIKEGNILIKNIGEYKSISLSDDNEGSKKLKEKFKKLSPNYLAEIIQIRPYKGNENLPEKIRTILENVPEYAGIPYWSEKHQRYWELYSSAEIIQKIKVNDNLTKINADLEMEPFGMIHNSIVIEQTDDYLLYVSTNNNDMRFEDKFTCIKKHNMKSAILLFRSEDNWILYGAGGVKSLKVVFLEKRIELSFINRIKTFCNFIFTKI